MPDVKSEESNQQHNESVEDYRQREHDRRHNIFNALESKDLDVLTKCLIAADEARKKANESK